jgi:hypothetical protein
MNKPFTELPAPKRTHRLALVAMWNPIETGDLRCERVGCSEPYLTDEITECPCCGRWMCMACFAPFAPLCAECGKLSGYERDAIVELRAKLAQS